MNKKGLRPAVSGLIVVVLGSAALAASAMGGTSGEPAGHGSGEAAEPTIVPAKRTLEETLVVIDGCFARYALPDSTIPDDDWASFGPGTHHECVAQANALWNGKP
jgi:hypothetical protein